MAEFMAANPWWMFCIFPFIIGCVVGAAVMEASRDRPDGFGRNARQRRDAD